MSTTRVIAPLVCAVAAAVLPAWSKSSPTAPGTVTSITMQPGQTATVGPERTALTFERVAYDQRCPWNALCIANHDDHALLVFRVGSSRAPGEAFLRAGGRTDHLQVPGATITPTSLKPDPWAPYDWPHEDYRVTLDVGPD